jgi:hypothetical protein
MTSMSMSLNDMHDIISKAETYMYWCVHLLYIESLELALTMFILDRLERPCFALTVISSSGNQTSSIVGYIPLPQDRNKKAPRRLPFSWKISRHRISRPSFGYFTTRMFYPDFRFDLTHFMYVLSLAKALLDLRDIH